MEELLTTADIWKKKDNSPLGIFSSQSMIIDDVHRFSIVNEIETRLIALERIEAERNYLENLLKFVENAEIVFDYGN